MSSVRILGPGCGSVQLRRMCSTTAQADRLGYMRAAAASNLGNTDLKPADWDNAKPYEQIPGPKPIPILGNVWRYFPLIGNMYKMNQIQQQTYLQKEFGDLVKLSGLKIRKDLIILFSPEDIEKSYRNEGVWPLRESMDSFVHYKMDVREDIFKGEGGVLTSQGEQWYRTRSTVNSVLMQPRAAKRYVTSMDDVAGELVKRMATLGPRMPKDFLHDINRWALESICVVALNKRLGLLDPEKKNPEAEQFINDVLDIFELFNDLEVKLSPWKYISTPSYRKFIKIMDRVTEFNIKHLREEMLKINENSDTKAYNEMGVLEKLLHKDEKVATAMVFDMLIAGIDTTSRISSAALYFLATNPEAQERLRNELREHLPHKNSPVTTSTLNHLPYLRAVIKETTRLAPISIGNLRQAAKDMVFSGYQVPKGSDLLMAHMILCRKEEHFKEAERFIPERWLRGGDPPFSSPWVFQPFGFGPRSCVGKRLANLEIEILLSKVIRNYVIEWPNPEMEWTFSLLFGVGSPLEFHITPVKD